MRYLVQLGAREIAVEVRFSADGTAQAEVGDDRTLFELLAAPPTAPPTGRTAPAGVAPARGPAEPAGTAGCMVVRASDGRMTELVYDRSGSEIDFAAGTMRGRARVESEQARGVTRTRAGAQKARAGGGAGVVRAPMPGRIVRVLVEQGGAVETGARLVVIEAMKMENELVASISGIVAAVRVRAGDAVEAGAELIVLE